MGIKIAWHILFFTKQLQSFCSQYVTRVQHTHVPRHSFLEGLELREDRVRGAADGGLSPQTSTQPSLLSVASRRIISESFATLQAHLAPA